MIRHAPRLTGKLKNLAHATRAMLTLEQARRPALHPYLAAHHRTLSPAACACVAGGCTGGGGAAGPSVGGDVALRDWDDLFNAVKARLRSVACDDLAAPEGPLLADHAQAMKASVLECVAALDQLQLTMAHEIARLQKLELEVFDARTALAQAIKRV